MMLTRRSWWLFLFGLLACGGLGPVSVALAQDAAARFPEANRVVADYPDPAQAYVALNLLWDTLKAKSAEAPDARTKRGTYYNASSAIEQRQIIAGNNAATNFNYRVWQLKMDKNFRSAVLAKYHLAEVPVETPPQRPAASQPAMPDANVTDAMIQGAVAKASPFFLGTLVALVFIALKLMRGSTKSPTLDSNGFSADGLPTLPEPVRVVQVPGLEYTVGVRSGLILDKESRTDTQVTTTVRQGQVYEMAGQLHSTPGQVMTTSTTTLTEVVWLLTPQKEERSWTFIGGEFRTRPGHLISAVVRLVPNDLMEFMAAYNHTTKQFKYFGSGTVHMPKNGLWGWLLPLLAGGVGFGIAFWIVLSISPPEHRDPAWIYPASLFVMGAVVAGVLELFVILFLKKRIFNRREEKFTREYLPRLREFLEQRTGPLEKHFGNVGVVGR